MKKIFYFLTAAAMLAVGCTQEGIDTPEQDYLTFDISLEGVAATRSATIGDGSHCDKLVYEVYDATGSTDTNPIVGDVISTLSSETLGQTKIVGGKATIKLNLAKGQSYAIAFWAQSSECAAYDTLSLKNVGIDYTTLANVENRDAFFAFVEPFKVAGAFNHQVTLRRPFAQLNLAVADLDAVKAAAINLEDVTVTTTAATKLDLTTGKVSDEQAVEFSTAAVLENAVLALADESTYPWIAMNYLLPNDVTTGADRITENVSFVIGTNKAPITLTSNATPLQRNWRTNIIAKLTEVNSFSIVIDDKFDGDIYIQDGEPEYWGVTMDGKRYETINDALLNASDNALITLAAGEYDLTAGGATVKASTEPNALVISNGITIQAAAGLSAEDVILNGPVKLKKGALKNVTLSGVGVADKSDLITGAFYGDCLVENVIFNCPATGTVNAFKELSGAGDGKIYNLTFKNCTFNANGQRPLQFDIMNVTVDGCTFDNPYRYVVQLGEYSKGCNLTFKNNTVKNYGSTNKDFYTYVQIADVGADKNNVVSLEANTQSTVVDGAAEKWVDYYVENIDSNVKVTVDGFMIPAEGVIYDAEDEAYHIESGAGLVWVAEQTEKGEDFRGETIIIDGDITIPEGETWTPIGSDDTPFSGTLEGNNSVISGITVSEDTEFSGLVGKLNSGAVIKNITLKNVNITARDKMAGAIAGYNEGFIYNCHIDGGSITSDLANVGGITGINAGINGAVIAGCSVKNVTITGTGESNYIGGGIAATNTTSAVIIACYTENVTLIGFQTAGGIVGLNTAGYQRRIANIIGSYSIVCIADETVLTGVYNIAKDNATNTNGSAIINTCFYKADNQFYGFDQVGETVTADAPVSAWSDAQNAMNTAIAGWNAGHANRCLWQWGAEEGSLVEIQ